jgi:hypothetical protein
MHDDLAQIDVSPLDTLARIKGELTTLDNRLATMQSRRDSVAAPVYARVEADYEQRRRALEGEAAPLKTAARASYATLRALLQRCEAEHESSRLDREEVEFRFSLGEFDEADFQQRLVDVDRHLAEKAAVRESADALRERFLAAFNDAEDLEHAALPPAAPSPDGATPPPAGSNAATVQMRTLDPTTLPGGQPLPPSFTAESAAVSPPAPRAAADAATQVMRVLSPEDVASRAQRSDQTLLMRTARLLPQNPAAGAHPIVLAIKPIVFGSGKDCDVKLAGARARHAEIRASMAGFTLTDLGGGVRVNGAALEQHLLRQDDAIDIGPALYVFRES